MRLRPFRLHSLPFFLASAAMPACGGDAPPGPQPPTEATTLALAAGDEQTAAVGSPLARPIRVVLRGAGGQPVADAPVAWTVVQGGGTLSTAVSTTDATGHAQTSWTLGLAAGTQAVTASRPGLPAVTVRATAVPDAEKPALMDFAISPRELNVSQAAREVELRTTVVDAGAGVGLVLVAYERSAGEPPVQCARERPSSGIAQSGTFACRVPVPQHAPDGTWRVTEIVVRDRVGNEQRYSPAVLAARGLPTAFAVTSTSADVAAPVLTAVTIAPATIDVTAADQVVRLTATVHEAGTGVTQVQASVTAPGAAGNQGQHSQCFATAPSTGTVFDGTWVCDLIVNRGMAPGAWQVVFVSAGDEAGNRVQHYTSYLRGAGFPTEFQVTNAAPDLTPPTLTGFSLAPAVVDLSGGAASIDFALDVADAQTGVAMVSVGLAAPGATSGTGCGTLTPSSGTTQQGTFRCRHIIPAGAPSGDWSVDVTLRDAAKNGRRLSPAELRALGFPSTVRVTYAP